jgi:hypothetical protein
VLSSGRSALPPHFGHLICPFSCSLIVRVCVTSRFHALRRHIVWLKTESLRRGWGEPQWLFPNEEGSPLDGSRARKVFRAALTAAKLPSFRVYDLRHTFGSLLLSMNAALVYVSQQMGHQSPTTTLKWYAKYIPGTGKRWVNLLDLTSHAIAKNFGTKTWNQDDPGASGVLEAPGRSGEPSGIRTRDPLIKSQVLYLLS